MSINLINNNPFETARIKSKPLILDGAMGSYLQQQGLATDDVLWTTNINNTNPDLIVQTHLEYIEAGADIITTNTFRTNPSSLTKAGISNVAEFVKEAVALAHQSVIGKKVLIAGSNAPAEDCYQIKRTLSQENLAMNHCKHIDLLIDNGVDFVLNETQSHLDELRIICDHCDKNEIPYAISLYANRSTHLLSGENLETALSFFNDHNVLAIGLNCISPKFFEKVIGSIQLPEKWGFYLNCGSGQHTDKNIECGIQPIEYLEIIKKSILYKPSFIGSCCGSSPAHTKIIRKYLDGQNYS
ncbi:MAG TPA: homocysteine S-methyltransferase family protein [Ignavibacteriaceae bacterium]|nr:homocysteine S-methyltransferase family protein [Ignavibacteriaceae bacterium]